MMKKTYQKPELEVTGAQTATLLAGSGISVGGNTGIGIGEGTPPSEAGGKNNSMFEPADEPAGPSSIWE